MMTYEEQRLRSWIENATYHDLLAKWRFAKAGDPAFQGELGELYSKKMIEKREKIGSAEAAQISKEIGW